MALRSLAGERVALTLLAPDPEFTYKPFTVEEPFSLKPAERHAIPPIAEEFGATFVQNGLAAVDAEKRILSLADGEHWYDKNDVDLKLGTIVARLDRDRQIVRMDDGEELPYDAVVICVGARQVPAYARALTFRPAGEPLQMEEILRRAAASNSKRLAFVAPPGGTWPLPVYELALMGRRLAEQLDARDLECVVVTPEQSPLVMFGRLASESVASLLRSRGIRVVTGARVTDVDDRGLVWAPGHERLEVGGVVALPSLQGPAIHGLPADDGGFIPIDLHARVRGTDGVYAAGDGTDFPIKQGGLATQQADAAAAHIAAAAGASVDPEPFHPVLRGRLLTGDESLSMSADVAGGGGEGVVSLDYLWWPPHKVSGRYLPAWLAGTDPRIDPEPPRHSLEVEVALPTEWHREPMALDPYGPPDTD